MFKKLFYFVAVAVTALAMSSCKLQIVPKAINTVNSVGLEEMNLERKDYSILKTLTAEATITYHQTGSKITIKEANGECSMVFKRVPFSKTYVYKKFEGIARYGYLNNDYDKGALAGWSVPDEIRPEYIARNLAIYRLINACKMAGGDGVIEPIISTNVERTGLRTVTFKSTVSAKVIKLKTDGK